LKLRSEPLSSTVAITILPTTLSYQDENQSGVKSSRPALNKMMEAVRRGEISKVIVYSFSRYARSVTHLLSALEEFKKHNVSFISISENICDF